MKIKFFRKCCISLTGLLFGAASAQMLLPLVPVPGSVPYSTAAGGINDAGVIAGTYQTADQKLHGFYGTPEGNYTYLPDVSSDGWQVRAINNRGFVTGFSNDNAQLEFEVSPSGVIAPITSGGVQLQGLVQGINSAGYFVGDYRVSNPAVPGQINGYYGFQGQYVADITLPFPTQRTRPRAFNNRGDVAGFINIPGEVQQGFLLRNGVVTLIGYPDPNVANTSLEGINDQGVIVGSWGDSAGNFHSFLLSADLSTITNIIVPNSTFVQAWSINNAGEVVVNADLGGYIYCSKGGGVCKKLHGTAVPTTITAVAPGSFPTYTCADSCVGVPRGKHLVSQDHRIPQ